VSKKFKVILMQEASDFIDALEEKARYKIIYNMNKASQTNDKELFKKLSNEIWEFRTLYNKTYYRLFAFWDKTGNEDTLVVTTNGLVKKTDKIPSSEIEKADRLRIKYFQLKKQ